MAVVTRSVNASVDASTAMYAPRVDDGVVAGEDLPAGCPCYIKSDGKAWKCDGSTTGAASKFDGVTPKLYKTGEPVVLFGVGTRVHMFDADQTPGALMYVGAAGAWDNAATTGDTNGTLRMVTARIARVVRSL